MSQVGGNLLVRQVKPCDSGELSEVEELARSMTFQLGMICSDGWILASDTRGFDQFPVATGEKFLPAVVLSEVGKIIYRPDIGVIYACNGGSSISRHAGQLLEHKLNAGVGPEKRSDVLNDAALEALQQDNQQQHKWGGLVIIFWQPTIELWTIDLGSAAILCPKYAFGGFGNLAMLFIQRFYRFDSVKRLRFLAAHTVLEAHHFNPSMVDGLELWSSENGKITKASEDELTELRNRSHKIYVRLNRLLVA